MSKKICCCDQCKLNQILKQVEALSNVVDELRTELNQLKKISFDVNHEDVCFEFIKENNKIDYASPNILQKVKTYFENIGFSTRIDETCRFTKNSQVLKKESQRPIRFSTIYGNLKYFKNKIIKNIQSIRKTQESAKNTKNKCVTCSQEQHEMYLFQKKEEQNSLKFNKRNEQINKYTDISEELCNSADTSFTSDASAQADIAICSRQRNNKKSHNCNCLADRNITENNEQISPLSMINDDRSVIHSDRFANKLLKNHVRQMFLKNKIKKYKKCSCGKQCPYALYKMPCNEYRYSTPEKKVNDKISGLSLECLSFEEKRDFSKFINVNTVQNTGCFMDSPPVEIGMNESLTSSLSVDLEVDICNDYCDLENVNEFTKLRKARTYIINRTNTEKNDLIKDFRTENEPSFNIISSWRNINEKKKKIDEIVNKVLSQKRYLYSGENNQEYKKSGTENFVGNYWPINDNKQTQCVTPALTTPMFNRKISIKTSTSNFQQRGTHVYRMTNKTKCNSFPKIIIPRQMKTNIQHSDSCVCLNCIQNRSLILDNCTNKKYAKKTDIKDKGKIITRKKNICDICSIEMDASSSEII